MKSLLTLLLVTICATTLQAADLSKDLTVSSTLKLPDGTVLTATNSVLTTDTAQTATADKTLSGTIRVTGPMFATNATVSGTLSAPNGLVGDPDKIGYRGMAVCFEGDSITAGQGTSNAATKRFSALFANMSWAKYRATIYNDAVSGYLLSQMEASYSSLVYPHRPTANGGDGGPISTIHLLGGTNDINSGRTSSQVIADLTSMVSERKGHGFRVFVSTILPRSDGSWNATKEGYRQVVNDAIRKNTIGADGIVDLARQLSNSRDTSLYPDGLHPGDVGHAVLAKFINDGFEAGFHAAATPSFFENGATIEGPLFYTDVFPNSVANKARYVSNFLGVWGMGVWGDGVTEFYGGNNGYKFYRGSSSTASGTLVLTVGSTNSSTVIASGQISAVTFSGSGASLSDLNASNLSSGTVPDARLSTNVVTTTGGFTIGGNNTLSGSLTLSSSATILTRLTNTSYYNSGSTTPSGSYPALELKSIAGDGMGMLDFYTYSSQNIPTARILGMDVSGYNGKFAFQTTTGGSPNAALSNRLEIYKNNSTFSTPLSVVSGATTTSAWLTVGAPGAAVGSGEGNILIGGQGKLYFYNVTNSSYLYESTGLHYAGDSGHPFYLDASSLIINTAGQGLRIKEGANARMGVSTLSSGTVAVSNTSVTATTRIFLTAQTDSTNAAAIWVSARTAATSFTIKSANASDNRAVAWQLVEPAP